MASVSRRKSGSSSGVARRISDRRRDKEILNFLLERRRLAEDIAAKCSEPRQPLSVYSKLPFPLLNQPNGQKMPRWDRLTPWLKLQIAILCFSEWDQKFLTFTVHLNSTLVSNWVSLGPDISRRRFRDRLRRYLFSEFGENREFLFAIEGLSRRSRTPARLHIHGAVMIRQCGERGRTEAAIHKAAGQGLRGRRKDPKALHTKMFKGGDAKWGNYILKFVNVADTRLAERRIGMSISTISSASAFWDLLTGRWGNKEVYARLKATMTPAEPDYEAKPGVDYRAILKRLGSVGTCQATSLAKT